MVKKKIIALLVVTSLAAVLALVGCGSSEADTAAPEAESAPATESAPETETAPATEAAPATETAPATENEPAADAAAAPADATYIGDDAAKEAALAHAGIAEADTAGLSVELDSDDNPVHYSVEFKSGGMEYDYDVDAVTGEILKSESEPED